MRNDKQKDRNKQRGSATIEAVVAFTAFLLAFFTIIGVVNYCRVQMQISAAVDTAARELSQYAYFYDMSGLQKFDLALKKEAGNATERINDVLATVDGLYTTVGNAMDQSAEDMTNLTNAIDQGTVSIDSIKETVNKFSERETAIGEMMTEMEGKLDEIGDNPVLYMRSLVAIAGDSGMDLAKRAIAFSLSKMFVLKHFGKTTGEQNETLKSLGVVDGVEGLNFRMSTMFTDDHCQEIQVVVFYRVNLSQFFDWEIFEVELCKQAVCSAWLGGDVKDVLVPDAGAGESMDADVGSGFGDEG